MADRAAEFTHLQVRGFLPTGDDLSELFARLTTFFGPAIQETDELVVFFKYGADMRLRFTRDDVELILQRRNRTGSDAPATRWVTRVQLNQAEALVRILDANGFKEGLFAPCYKYVYSNSSGMFILKMNSVCGDFFEFGRTSADPGELKETREQLVAIAEGELSLSVWSEPEYARHTEQCWEDVEKEPLVNTAGGLSPQIRALLAKYEFAPRATSVVDTSSLRTVLHARSNNYAELEETYRKRTGRELLGRETIAYSNDFLLTASIIVPILNDFDVLLYTLKGLEAQNLTPAQFEKLQLIIVDDGSDHKAAEQLLEMCTGGLKDRGVSVQFLRSTTNLGRGSARNLGIQIATGEVLIFLDADAMPEPHYVCETLIRHQEVGRLVLVGFKENVDMSQADPAELLARPPDITRDFRWARHVEKGWRGLYPVTEEREVSCLEETDYFRDFGHGRALGPWDLSCMVVGHSFSARRSAVQAVRGFNKAFGRDWGLEDTFLGACLIATGNYVVPLLSSGVYHLEKVPEAELGIRDAKYSQLERGYQIYRNLLDSPMSSLILGETSGRPF